MKLDADSVVAETGIPFEVLQRAFAATIVDEVVDERCDLTTLGDCSPEEFELRTIRLPGNKLVNIRHADGAQLGLLCRQLLAAGLPIPELLQRKLAVGEPA